MARTPMKLLNGIADGDTVELLEASVTLASRAQGSQPNRPPWEVQPGTRGVVERSSPLAGLLRVTVQAADGMHDSIVISARDVKKVE